MCLRSDGSDRKIISQQTDHKRISRDECQTMSYPEVYSSTADSLAGIIMFIQKAYFQELTNHFYPIILLNVIRTKP